MNISNFVMFGLQLDRVLKVNAEIKKKLKWFKQTNYSSVFLYLSLWKNLM